jgi:hypothetical protein
MKNFGLYTSDIGLQHIVMNKAQDQNVEVNNIITTLNTLSIR